MDDQTEFDLLKARFAQLESRIYDLGLRRGDHQEIRSRIDEWVKNGVKELAESFKRQAETAVYGAMQTYRQPIRHYQKLHSKRLKNDMHRCFC